MLWTRPSCLGTTDTTIVYIVFRTTDATVVYIVHTTIVPGTGLYKPCTSRTSHTGPCTNHAPAILAAPALIYNTHQLLVVWIIVVNFHLCSLLGTPSHYTLQEV